MRSLIVTGKRLFADPGQPRALRLIEASAVGSDGVITARYEPRRAYMIDCPRWLDQERPPRQGPAAGR